MIKVFIVSAIVNNSFIGLLTLWVFCQVKVTQ